MSKNLYWRVNTPELLSEIANNSKDAQGVGRPIDIFGKILYAVASRAREINDEELNSLMLRLNLYQAVGDGDVQKKVSDLIHKYDDAIIERIRN